MSCLHKSACANAAATFVPFATPSAGGGATKKNRIIELAVCTDSGERWSTLVNPGKDHQIEPGAHAVHGISHSDVRHPSVPDSRYP